MNPHCQLTLMLPCPCCSPLGRERRWLWREQQYGWRGLLTALVTSPPRLLGTQVAPYLHDPAPCCNRNPGDHFEAWSGSPCLGGSGLQQGPPPWPSSPDIWPCPHRPAHRCAELRTGGQGARRGLLGSARASYLRGAGSWQAEREAAAKHQRTKYCLGPEGGGGAQ